MNNILKSSVVIFCVIGMQNAFAHDHEHGNNACKPVKEACEKAGKKKKEAWACVKTIKGGGTVDGVTVSDTDLAACKASPAK